MPSSKLPAPLKALFWDYDFTALSWENDRDLIMARVLTAGSWDTVTWLRSRAGDHALREWIERRCGGGMSPQRLRFWELILELPRRQVVYFDDADRERMPRMLWDTDWRAVKKTLREWVRTIAG